VADGLTLGVDIGGTKVLGGVVDVDGTVLAQARRETPADDTTRTLERIVEVIAELTAVYEVEAIGIGAAGWIDAKRSTVLFAPNLAWRNEPLREEVARHVSVPVVVENDANVAAWAEFQYGAAVFQVPPPLSDWKTSSRPMYTWLAFEGSTTSVWLYQACAPTLSGP